MAFFTRFIMHQDLDRAILLTLGAETLGFFLSGLLREVYRRLAAERAMRAGIIVRVFLLTFLAAVFQAAILQVAISFLGWQSFRMTLWERWLLLSISMWFVYLAWSLGYFWVKAELRAHEERRRAAEARAAEQRMELQLLRFQLDPHFLFNSLNGVMSEIPTHPQAAVEMVGELSRYLRYSLDHRHQLLTRLAVELDATEAYLKIQQARFADRLQAGIRASRSAREILVPSFFLQPLVENAFKHGFATRPPPWTLDISAEVEDGHLMIRVRNSGEPEPGTHENGLGLDTVRRRLELHYPARHRFHIGSADGATLVTLDLEGLPCSV